MVTLDCSVTLDPSVTTAVTLTVIITDTDRSIIFNITTPMVISGAQTFSHSINNSEPLSLFTCTATADDATHSMFIDGSSQISNSILSIAEDQFEGMPTRLLQMTMYIYGYVYRAHGRRYMVI